HPADDQADVSGNAASYERLADLYSRLGDSAKAEQCFSREEQQCDSGYLQRADFFRRRGLHSKALAAYQSAIQHGDVIAGCEGKGDVYWHESKPGDALAAYSAAIQVDTDSSEPDPYLLLKRSRAYSALGKSALARKDEETAIALATKTVDKEQDSTSYHD